MKKRELNQWKKYHEALKIYVKEFAKWIKAQGETGPSTFDGGSNPPPPPPPKPPTGH